MRDTAVTSIMAYHDLNLGLKQYEVVKAVSHLQTIGRPVSCENVCKYLGYTANRVTGRLKELRDLGAITFDSFTKSSFGKSVETYKLVTKGQENLL